MGRIKWGRTHGLITWGESSIWTGHRAVISFILHKSIFIHFLHHGTRFYYSYITSDDRKKYIDDDGGVVFPKQKVRNIYNEKYQKTYSNLYYVLKYDYIKDKRISRTYSGRKQRSIGYVCLKISRYCDAKGSSHLRLYINDTIINAAPRIGENLTNWNCIESSHTEE